MTIDVQGLEPIATQTPTNSTVQARRQVSTSEAEKDSASVSLGATALSDAVIKLTRNQQAGGGASPERLATLNQAVRTGCLPVDIRNLAEAILREEGQVSI